MEFVAELLASGDIFTALIIVLILLVTGGVGAAVVNGIIASRRGVKGDALVKEQNAISGLGTLTEGQQGFITQLREEFAAFKTDSNTRIRDLETRVTTAEIKLEAEMQYNSLLVTQLIAEGVAPVPRPAPKTS